MTTDTQEPLALSLEEALKHLGNEIDGTLIWFNEFWHGLSGNPDGGGYEFQPLFCAEWPQAVGELLGEFVTARDEAAELKAALARLLSIVDEHGLYDQVYGDVRDDIDGLRRLVGTEGDA